MQILAEMTMSIRLTARQANDHHKAIERLASTIGFVWVNAQSDSLRRQR